MGAGQPATVVHGGKPGNRHTPLPCSSPPHRPLPLSLSLSLSLPRSLPVCLAPLPSRLFALVLCSPYMPVTPRSREGRERKGRDGKGRARQEKRARAHLFAEIVVRVGQVGGGVEGEDEDEAQDVVEGEQGRPLRLVQHRPRHCNGDQADREAPRAQRHQPTPQRGIHPRRLLQRGEVLRDRGGHAVRWMTG